MPAGAEHAGGLDDDPVGGVVLEQVQQPDGADDVGCGASRGMMWSMQEARRYHDVAAAAWRWALDQVTWDDEGPVVPESVDQGVPHELPPEYCDGMHSGAGGLAHVLAEVRLLRDWTDEESALAAGIAVRLRLHIADLTDVTFFDGLGSSIGALVALGSPGVGIATQRLLDLADPDGWPQT